MTKSKKTNNKNATKNFFLIIIIIKYMVFIYDLELKDAYFPKFWTKYEKSQKRGIYEKI